MWATLEVQAVREQMVVTAATEVTEQARGRLRRMNPIRDLSTIADLIGRAFADEIDERGRAALREMRWMAHLSPLVWWWSQADPSFQDAFNGFVWEEPAPQGEGMRRSQQVVGNVSLNRAPGNRRRWIICNVVVEDAYRGQGIGRRLMEAAIAEAQQIGAEGVVLQVHRDNPTALRLYKSMGFREASGETDLWLEAPSPVDVPQIPGYHLRPWEPADGSVVYDLARRIMPPTQQWIRPVRSDEFRPDSLIRLGRWISGLVTGRRVHRLTALKEERLAAMMAVTMALRRGEHRLALLVHPDDVGQVEAVMIGRGLHMLAGLSPRPVRITVDMDYREVLHVLQAYGFREQRTLLTLRKDFE
ncbi:MAG TPA: GNAT family N-acetyltransferase [Anaerolineae bacterium]|nr:GNAT family N-acetyltransferase [Anaerolineae bacterium]